MKHALKFLPASSIATLMMLSCSAQAQDATFDVEADNPAVEAELSETEEELDEFFEESEADRVDPDPVILDADADTYAAKELLDRADRESTEFNDIDADDEAEPMIERSPTLDDAEPRLENPAQVEKDIPALDCPAGTTEGVDGTCVAGPDWEFSD